MAKRKPKTLNNLMRKESTRHPAKRILIVCEGETERLYLIGIKKKFKLGITKEINIPDDNDPSPISVVNYAIEKFNIDKKDNTNNEYDHVYCVIDRDSHSSYDKAVIKINEQNKIISGDKFKISLSDPCIEYWLLLHFTYTDKPYTCNNHKSRADYAKSDLKKYIPKYSKTDKNVIESFLNKLDVALKNAKKADMAAKKRGDTNPSTKLHELIKKLNEDDLESSEKI